MAGFGNYYLTEAITIDNLNKSIALIKTSLEKRLNTTLYNEYGVNHFSNSLGEGFGIRYFIGDTNQAIRFNYKNNMIESVDIWDKTNNPSPVVRLETQGISIAQIIPQIVQLLQNPNASDFVEVTEATTTDRPKVIKSRMNVKKISNEKQIVDADADEEILDDTEYADPEVIFDDLDKLVTLVITGKRNSLIVSGLAGVGKSYNVEQTVLNNKLVESRDYVIIKGKSTTYALYQSLFENKDKLIIYDDCDSILKNKDSLNILKAALDTGNRTISWKSKSTFNPTDMETSDVKIMIKDGKLPDKFIFRGKIIFITNIYYKNLDEAVVSRSFVIDITLKATDILMRIESILREIMKDVPQATMPIKKEVLNYFKVIIKSGQWNKPMNIRSFIAGVQVRLSGAQDWQRLILRYC